MECPLKKVAVVKRWPIVEVDCISVLNKKEKLSVRLQLCFLVQFLLS